MSVRSSVSLSVNLSVTPADSGLRKISSKNKVRSHVHYAFNYLFAQDNLPIILIYYIIAHILIKLFKIQMKILFLVMTRDFRPWLQILDLQFLNLKLLIESFLPLGYNTLIQ